jgi:hypothetical protein
MIAIGISTINGRACQVWSGEGRVVLEDGDGVKYDITDRFSLGRITSVVCEGDRVTASDGNASVTYAGDPVAAY